MDVHCINPFVKSVCNTFETACSMPVSIGKGEFAAKVGMVMGKKPAQVSSSEAAGAIS